MLVTPAGPRLVRAPMAEYDEAEAAKPRHSPLIAVVLIAALAVTLAGIFPFRQILAQNRQVDNTEAKLAALQDENAALEEAIEALNTDVELERLAREQLGMVEEGEIGVIPVDPAPGGEPPSAVDPASQFDERGLFEKVWDFLTGRDLEPDG